MFFPGVLDGIQATEADPAPACFQPPPPIFSSIWTLLCCLHVVANGSFRLAPVMPSVCHKPYLRSSLKIPHCPLPAADISSFYPPPPSCPPKERSASGLPTALCSQRFQWCPVSVWAVLWNLAQTKTRNYTYLQIKRNVKSCISTQTKKTSWLSENRVISWSKDCCLPLSSLFNPLEGILQSD